MRIVLLLALLLGSLAAGRVHALPWPSGMTLPRYLEEHNLSLLLKTISPEDMESVAEIQAGETYYELRDHREIIQILIPLGEEMQIQIRRDDSGVYRFDIVPIVFREVSDAVSLSIHDSYHKQINRHTHHPRLSFMLSRLYKKDVSFRALQPEDRIAFAYTQKERLGQPFGAPAIQAALLDTQGKEHFVFVDSRGEVHKGVKKTVVYATTEKRPFTYTTVRKVKTKKFRMPLDHPRITSRFTLRRWHPILKKYRPHFGVDFGARRGTPLRAVNDGKVVYAGWMRGYGKVVKINHGAGFVSLYAHQSKILVKLHQYVKRGQTIGKVGSTGRSTGPHLHFGLYHNGKPVDPLKYIARRGTGKTRSVVEKHTVMKTYPVTKRRYVEIKGARQAKERLEKLITAETTQNYIWPATHESMIRLNDVVVDTKEQAGGEHG
jgi:murein DD-endopeptidase MepM/ murein hydrolase activator NlpD